MSAPRRTDRFFLANVVVLAVLGFFVFTSASLGLISRSGASFRLVAAKQLIILIIGTLACLVVSRLDYKLWRKAALWLFVGSFIATLLVFVPHLGFSAGGARRWIIIGGFSLQTSELLKLGFIVYMAAWISMMKDKINSPLRGFLPFCILLLLTAIPLLLQPDTDTCGVIIFAALAMFIVAGGHWRYLFSLIVAGVLVLAILFVVRPYIKQRIMTFIHPERDPQGASWQINQSLLAIGSGGITGRGFGQSVQKFSALPEPIGDSVFAVAGEEFGFIGTTVLVTLFLLFGLWGLKIAARAPDMFSRLLVVGLVILIVSESFVNISSMLGLIPLSGTPLLFVSQGGTALLMALVEAGLILNISRFQTS